MQLEHNIQQPVGERKATPILFLHGAWHAAWCYDLWMNEFAAHGYEAHSFSLPAHGQSKSGRSVNLYGLRDYVDALTQIVDSIKPTPYLVAHSLGGYVLQEYLKTHDLPAAVLLCPLPYFGAVPFYLRYFRKHPVRYLVAIATLNLGRMVNTPELAREYFLTEGAEVTPEQLASRLQNESMRVALRCILPIFNRQSKTPLLVMAAERDGIFPVSEEKRVAEKYHAELQVIPGQGHNLMVERDWQQVATRIRSWLESR